jgi:hypothetical protein
VPTHEREYHRVAVPMHCGARPAGWRRMELMKGRGISNKDLLRCVSERSASLAATRGDLRHLSDHSRIYGFKF